jgi:hypothetical protein
MQDYGLVPYRGRPIRRSSSTGCTDKGAEPKVGLINAGPHAPKGVRFFHLIVSAGEQRLCFQNGEITGR